MRLHKENDSANEFLVRPNAMPGLFIYENGNFLSPQSFVGFPARIRNRMLLHSIGACGMFTAIVRPGQQLDREDLVNIAESAAAVNRNIGLSVPVRNLVIRTRSDRPPDTSGKTSTDDPMLFIEGVDQARPVFWTMSEGRVNATIDSVITWANCYWNSQIKYMLLHDENPKDQLAAIHGRAMHKTVDQSWELKLGTKVPHARAIGEKGTPYLRANGHDIHWIVESLLNDDYRSLLYASSLNDAMRLAWRFESSVGRLVDVAETVKSLHRGTSDASFEFRLYCSGDLHVYDFDVGFHKQELASDEAQRVWGGQDWLVEMLSRGLGRD